MLISEGKQLPQAWIVDSENGICEMPDREQVYPLS